MEILEKLNKNLDYTNYFTTFERTSSSKIKPLKTD